MNKAVIAFALISLGVFATQGEAKIHPPCQQGYFQDSAGRGIEGGFTGQNLLPTPGNQDCYDDGAEQGSSLQKNDSQCQGQFSDGKNAGLVESGNSGTAKCFSYGYTAGVALLHVNARAGVVGDSPRGQQCLDFYQKGWADSARHSQQNSNTNDSLGNDCYLTGFYDQQQLN